MSTAASQRRGSLRATAISKRKRRAELTELSAAGLARVIAQRLEPPAGCSPDSEDCIVNELALSASSRLSVYTGGKFDPNESKVGDQA